MLRTPSGAKKLLWQNPHITHAGRFNLCEVTTKVTDHVSAFEIAWQALKSCLPLAARACAPLGDDIFPEIPELFLCLCSHTDQLCTASGIGAAPFAQGAKD